MNSLQRTASCRQMFIGGLIVIAGLPAIESHAATYNVPALDSTFQLNLDRPIRSLAFSPEGRSLLVVTHDDPALSGRHVPGAASGEMLLLDTNTLRIRWRLAQRDSWIRDATFLDAGTIASVGEAITLWNAKTGEFRTEICGGLDAWRVTAARGNRLAVLHRMRNPKPQQVESPLPWLDRLDVWRGRGERWYHVASDPTQFDRRTSRLAFSPDGQFLALSFNDMVKLRATRKWTSEATLDGALGQAFAFDPRSELLAVGGNRGQIGFFHKDIRLPNPACRLVRRSGAYSSVQYMGSQTLLSGGGAASLDYSVKLWDTESGRLKGVLTGPRSSVSKVAATAKTGWVAASTGKTLFVWRTDRLADSNDRVAAELYIDPDPGEVDSLAEVLTAPLDVRADVAALKERLRAAEEIMYRRQEDQVAKWASRLQDLALVAAAGATHKSGLVASDEELRLWRTLQFRLLGLIRASEVVEGGFLDLAATPFSFDDRVREATFRGDLIARYEGRIKPKWIRPYTDRMLKLADAEYHMSQLEHRRLVDDTSQGVLNMYVARRGENLPADWAEDLPVEYFSAEWALDHPLGSSLFSTLVLRPLVDEFGGRYVSSREIRIDHVDSETWRTNAGLKLRPFIERLAAISQEADEPLLRLGATRLLGDLAVHAKFDSTHFERLLERDHEKIRVAAAIGYWRLTGDLESVSAIVDEGLTSDNEQFRLHTWTTIFNRDSEAAQMLDTLVDHLLSDSVIHERYLGSRAGTSHWLFVRLLKIDPNAMHSLIQATWDRPAGQRAIAAYLLGRTVDHRLTTRKIYPIRTRPVERHAADIQAAFKQLWWLVEHDPDNRVALAAVQQLTRQARRVSLPLDRLESLLGHRSWHVRAEAAHALHFLAVENNVETLPRASAILEQLPSTTIDGVGTVRLLSVYLTDFSTIPLGDSAAIDRPGCDLSAGSWVYARVGYDLTETARQGIRLCRGSHELSRSRAFNRQDARNLVSPVWDVEFHEANSRRIDWLSLSLRARPNHLEPELRHSESFPISIRWHVAGRTPEETANCLCKDLATGNWRLVFESMTPAARSVAVQNVTRAALQHAEHMPPTKRYRLADEFWWHGIGLRQIESLRQWRRANTDSVFFDQVVNPADYFDDLTQFLTLPTQCTYQLYGVTNQTAGVAFWDLSGESQVARMQLLRVGHRWLIDHVESAPWNVPSDNQGPPPRSEKLDLPNQKTDK